MSQRKGEPCHLCTARSPWIRLRHSNEIAAQWLVYMGMCQVEHREAEVGDVVVWASVRPLWPTWDHVGVVVQRSNWNYRVWTPCGKIVGWSHVDIINYGRARGYDHSERGAR